MRFLSMGASGCRVSSGMLRFTVLQIQGPLHIDRTYLWHHAKKELRAFAHLRLLVGLRHGPGASRFPVREVRLSLFTPRG